MNTAAAFDLTPFATRVDPRLLAAWTYANVRARASYLRDPFRASRELALLEIKRLYQRESITRAQYRSEIEEVAGW